MGLATMSTKLSHIRLIKLPPTIYLFALPFSSSLLSGQGCDSIRHASVNSSRRGIQKDDIVIFGYRLHLYFCFKKSLSRVEKRFCFKKSLSCVESLLFSVESLDNTGNAYLLFLDAGFF
jgi:hypothetical protein